MNIIITYRRGLCILWCMWRMLPWRLFLRAALQRCVLRSIKLIELLVQARRRQLGHHPIKLPSPLPNVTAPNVCFVQLNTTQPSPTVLDC